MFFMNEKHEEQERSSIPVARFRKLFSFKVLIPFCLKFIVYYLLSMVLWLYKQWKHNQLSRNNDLFNKSSQSSSNIIEHPREGNISFITETEIEATW